ncbi:MAG: DUF4432 family protein [Spirochaetaceae bacterium]
MHLPSQLSNLCKAGALQDAETTLFTETDLRTGEFTRREVGPVVAETFRGSGDAADVRRLRLSWEAGELELLPTKGLTVGPLRHGEWRPFWEPVVPGLISPEDEDLLGAMLIHGERVESMRWLENFAGCVELLGLSNWGMAYRPPKGAVTLPLHGEASHVPVSEVQVAAVEGCVVARAPFEVRHAWWDDPDTSVSWYRRGVRRWGVVRTIIMDTEVQALHLVDEITNLGGEAAQPDWGYHYQLRAVEGARLLIPSESVEDRFGGEVPERFEAWEATPDPAVRYERGYIHKGVTVETSPIGTAAVRGAAIYPDGTSTLVTMPASTYTLSWFSCGGKGSMEFAFPERPRESAVAVAWDGMGPEIGASPLDHDGNADPRIRHEPVPPGGAQTLYSCLRAATPGEVAEIEERFHPQAR